MGRTDLVNLKREPILSSDQLFLLTLSVRRKIETQRPFEDSNLLYKIRRVTLRVKSKILV